MYVRHICNMCSVFVLSGASSNDKKKQTSLSKAPRKFPGKNCMPQEIRPYDRGLSRHNDGLHNPLIGPYFFGGWGGIGEMAYRCGFLTTY